MPEDDLTPAQNGFDTDAPARSDVVLDLLGELRAARYTPTGWARFGVRSWRLARHTANSHPRLTRSWRRVALGLALAELLALVAEERLGGDEAVRAARRAAPGAALCLAYTLADAYVHLGMNQETYGAPLHDTLGLPTILTLSRSVLAGLLIGHLVGGEPASDAVLSLALTVASLTDIADGQLARILHRQTRLGAYLDSTADCGVALAATLTLVERRALPRWFVAGILARWLMPFTYALVSYFGTGRRVRIGSTWAGKAAGVAQTLTLGVASLPERLRSRRRGLQCVLHVTTLALLVLAPLAQFMNQFMKTRSRS
ncbi:MAG TPA: CDP-alcohol phosphatidyltransferase family protein [Ktedonobacterales bacterium]|nr:CDP-alcohol phosphatidyltransferase family protein [Ktedonobacterales bacterium]